MLKYNTEKMVELADNYLAGIMTMSDVTNRFFFDPFEEPEAGWPEDENGCLPPGLLVIEMNKLWAQELEATGKVNYAELITEFKRIAAEGL